MHARLQDVADLAKVSIFSVSKVVNGTWREARISEESATRILSAARQLGYIANYHAQALISGQSKTIGIVKLEPQFNDFDFTSELIEGIETQLAICQHDLLILGRRGASTEIQHGMQCLRQKRIDALVVPGCIGESIWNDEFESAPGVIVLAVRKPNSVHPAVDVDPVPGINSAIQLLVEQGHRTMLWLSPRTPGGTQAIDTRKQALLRASLTHGISVTEATFQAMTWSRDATDVSELARRCFIDLARTPYAFTAIMCYNDATAYGVYMAAYELGLHIPRDLSVVGFDDFGRQRIVPRLTTISHELAAIGARAAELAIELAQDPELHKRRRGQVETIPARLVVRESTAPPLTSQQHPR